LESAAALPQVASVLQDAASKARNARPGEVSVCLMDPSLPGEVEMTLGQSFPLNPQVKGALKSLNDVIDVEEV
jgi:DNA polymerase-3 subunit alpha